MSSASVESVNVFTLLERWYFFMHICQTFRVDWHLTFARRCCFTLFQTYVTPSHLYLVFYVLYVIGSGLHIFKKRPKSYHVARA